MLVILTHQADEIASDLASRWPDTRLMTPRDLSTRGWSHSHRGEREEQAVVGGEVVPVGEISAVYTRLHGVTENDLPSIVKDDRRYVAAEMTAFLLSWLSSLTCPVVNRPSPLGLAGPNLRWEAWISRASGAGIPVRPVSRGSDGYRESELQDPLTLSVVGSRTIGQATNELKSSAVRLAHAAGVVLMTAVFDRAQPSLPLVTAGPFVDIRSDGVGEAVLHHLLDHSRAQVRP
jgi:hypothetical protein